MSLPTSLHNRLFSAFQRRTLIYNACCEDPAIDREALELEPSDRVLVITSGGCNALDYLLAGAGSVEAVDLNPCQNALLEFKAAAIRSLDYASFWEMFGMGWSKRANEMYRDAIRPRLSPPARRFWDRRLSMLRGTGARRSFYHHGGWGLMMWLIVGYWRTCRGLEQPLHDLFRTTSIAEQWQIYETRLRNRVWTPWFAWVASRSVSHALLGIPQRQRRYILGDPVGLHRWGQEMLDDLFANVPFATNYFMRANVLGCYAPDCCPEYLTPEGFARLKGGLLERLTIHTATVTEHLRSATPGISKFALLDHADWMDARELAEEWELILAAARGGAKAIFRSALANVDYLDPIQVSYQGRSESLGTLLQYDRVRAAALHARDRLHLYRSFCIATSP